MTKKIRRCFAGGGDGDGDGDGRLPKLLSSLDHNEAKSKTPIEKEVGWEKNETDRKEE